MVKRSRRDEQVPLELFWREVVDGTLGIKPLPVKTSEQVEGDRTQAAILEGQVVSLPAATLVLHSFQEYIYIEY